MTIRTLLHVPATARAGEVVEVRTHIQHAMETGHRQSATGTPVPRDLVRRIECHFEDQRVFAADLHAAIAANPYVAFFVKVPRSGTLRVAWSGDNGLQQSASANITVVA